MSSYTFAEGFSLSVNTYFDQPIDYNHRSIAWQTGYLYDGIYLEYGQSISELCCYIIVKGQEVFSDCMTVPESEWNGDDLLWHELSIVYAGDQVQTFRDGKIDFSCTDDRLKDLEKSGTIRLSASGSITCYDDVMLVSLQSYICGDANGSQTVDIDDVVHLVAYIFSGGPAPNPIEAGDVDCSSGVDIDDVVYLIGYIFSGGLPPCANCL